MHPDRFEKTLAEKVFTNGSDTKFVVEAYRQTCSHTDRQKHREAPTHARTLARTHPRTHPLHITET